ncbi:hypothetical protein L7F22_025753 [Adiantum nelumboides]|nr:hypothetical protein [Adiantum nelumboides]
MNGESEGRDKPQENDLAKQVAVLVQQAKALQSAGSSLSTRLRIEEQTLSQQAVALEKEIGRIRADIFSALEKDELSQDLAEKIEEDVERAHGIVCEGDVGALLPPKYSGRFLKMLLGPVNVKAAGTDVRFKAKEEYNAYRVGGILRYCNKALGYCNKT